MQAKQLESQLAELTAAQWGLVTTRQAGGRGISRVDLTRLTNAGRLERLTQGVYRIASTPATLFDDLHAAWLAADPGLIASDRDRDDVIVGGATAAWLHEIGDLQPTPYIFLSRTRRQTKRADVRFRRRHVDPADITTVQGVPTTTITRTIADLVLDREDESLTADVLRDAVSQGHEPDRARLAELLALDAVRRGLPAGDGAAVYAQLEEKAGTDAAGRLTTLSRTVSIPHLVNPVTTRAIIDHRPEQFAPVQELVTKLRLSDQAAALLAKISLAWPAIDTISADPDVASFSTDAHDR